MTQIRRSRRLQAGLVGLSVVSALGAAVGLGLTTHTHSSQQSGSGGDGTGRAAAQRQDDGDDGARATSAQRSAGRSSGTVSPPSGSTPQATTSGS
jgi:hypothetical protein